MRSRAVRSLRPSALVMVFAGYGLTVTDYGHDDLAGLDVAGKVVVALQGAPAAVPSTVAAHYSSIENVVQNYRKHGAVGALLILNPRLEEIPWERLSAIRSQFTNLMDLADPELRTSGILQFTAYMNPTHAGLLFEGSGISFDQVLAADTKRAPLPKGQLEGVLQVATAIETSNASSPNVLAVLPGSASWLSSGTSSNKGLLEAEGVHIELRTAFRPLCRLCQICARPIVTV